MIGFMLIALAVLFVLVLVEGVGIFALFRQIGVLHLSLAGPQTVRAPEPLPAGAHVPDLSGISPAGEPVSLAQYTGQRVLLAFVHPLCGPCNLIGPELEVLHRDASSGTSVVIVSDGDGPSTEEFAREHGLTAPVLYQPRDDYKNFAPALAECRVTMTPFAYLLGNDHTVITSGVIGGREFLWRVAKGLPNTDSDLIEIGPHTSASDTQVRSVALGAR